MTITSTHADQLQGLWLRVHEGLRGLEGVKRFRFGVHRFRAGGSEVWVLRLRVRDSVGLHGGKRAHDTAEGWRQPSLLQESESGSELLWRHL